VDIQTDRQTQRQTDRETYTKTDIHYREIERETASVKHVECYAEPRLRLYTYRQIQRDMWTYRQTDRHKDRQTERHIQRQTETTKRDRERDTECQTCLMLR